jgi:UPF0755 protein
MEYLKRQNPWVVAFVAAVFLVGSYQSLFAAPSTFPSGSVVTVARGTSAPSVADQFADAQVIRHPSLLLLALRMSGTSSRVQAGVYRFDKPQNVFVVAYRIVRGAYGLPPVRITFPEGVTVREVAAQIEDAFPGIRAADFLAEAQQYEGYLFPDTYLFPPSSDAASIVALMRENFNTKITTLSGEISASGRSLSDIVTMASLVEREARRSESKRMVAGILFNRLKIGMPLQVDAVFGYIFGRDTYSPSFADLKVDSPYNTYLHKGLPPGPIANPGLDSLQAVLNSTKTNYLYYITGKDNLMHYATTYAGHQDNRKKYLD